MEQRKDEISTPGRCSFLPCAIMADENLTVQYVLHASPSNPSPDSHTLIAAYADVASFCLGPDLKKKPTLAENAGGHCASHLVRPPAHPSYFHRTSHTPQHTHVHVHWICQDDGVAHAPPANRTRAGKVNKTSFYSINSSSDFQSPLWWPLITGHCRPEDLFNFSLLWKEGTLHLTTLAFIIMLARQC